MIRGVFGHHFSKKQEVFSGIHHSHGSGGIGLHNHGGGGIGLHNNVHGFHG